ncbi:hypothetical protein D3C81_1408270 [compost metagenome]
MFHGPARAVAVEDFQAQVFPFQFLFRCGEGGGGLLAEDDASAPVAVDALADEVVAVVVARVVAGEVQDLVQVDEAGMGRFAAGDAGGQ